MSWATERRLTILIIIGAIIVAFSVTVLIATFYEAPSCADNKQNQGEAGVDCGGPCAYLCTAEKRPPTILFTNTVQNGEGRSDAIAKVENKNLDAAAKNVPYRITFYGAGQILIREVLGVLDLPPSATVPVFVPGITSDNQLVTGAFLEIDSASVRWFSMPVDTRIVPHVSTPKLAGTAFAPRVEAVLTNPSVVALSNVKVIVLVHNSNGDIIAASSTVVPIIPAQEGATALFTWNGPFESVPAIVEVIPLISLP